MIDEQKLVALKYALQNDIANKLGISCVVQMQRTGTRRLQDLVIVAIIPNGNPFEAVQYEIYEDRQGNIYWGDALGNYNEDTREKVIN